MNKKNLLLILSIFFLLISFDSYANEYQEIVYKTKAGDSFASILWDFVYPDSIINANTPMTKKTIQSNPKIKNWNTLPEAQDITLYIDKKFLDMSKFAAYKKSLEPVRPTIVMPETSVTQAEIISTEMNGNENKTAWYKKINTSFEFGFKNEAIEDVNGTRKSETIKNEAIHLKFGADNPSWSFREFDPYTSLGIGLSSSPQAALDPSLDLTFGAKRYWENYSGFGTAGEISFQKDSYVYFLNSTLANKGEITASWLGLSIYKTFKMTAFPLTIGGDVAHSLTVSLVRAEIGGGVQGWREKIWLSAPLWDLGMFHLDYSQWHLSAGGYKLESRAYKTSIGINF